MSRRTDIKAGLRRWSTGWMGHVLGAELRVARGQAPGRCELVMRLPDIVDGELREFVRDFDVRGPAETWGPAIYAALERLLTHEARECLAFDGELVGDPHRRRAPCG